jgi:SAM-dependent methyltransferase
MIRMRLPFEPGRRPTAIDAHLGEIPVSLFDEETFACCELTERYATDLALDLARRLGLPPHLAAGGSADELLAALGYSPGFRPALVALLDRLAAAGELEVAPGGPPPAAVRFRAERPLREPELAELRELGLGFDPAMAPTLDLLDAAAAAYPAVARGSTTGENELFGAGRIGIWLAYFSNQNPVYSLNNRLAAVVAANRLPDGGGLRVLEIGAGAGSATRALLEELERRGRLEDLGRYDFTEPSPFFRRRGERELRALFPAVPFRFRALDVDEPFDSAGETEGYDLVLGVNVLHVARNLGAALARLRDALSPGCYLVAGECLRLFPGQPVPADLVFQLLHSFTDVVTDPSLRPSHGFLEPATWTRALEAAGFQSVAVVPDLDRIRQHYPRFFTGVVQGRRPTAGETREEDP